MERALLYLVLVVFPLGTRILLYQFTPGFHEYEAVFLYASDSALVLFLAVFLRSRFREFIEFLRRLPGRYPLFTFLALSALSLFFAVSTGLAIASFVRLLLFALFAVCAGFLLREERVRRAALWILIVMAALQAVLGTAQVIRDRHLGLQILGESPISVTDPGTSRFWADGFFVMRAYGTFPHPNVLAAFLLVGVFALYKIWMCIPSPALRVTRKNWKRLFVGYLPAIWKTTGLSILLFILFLGLTVTFSRAAWLIAFVGILVASSYWLMSRHYRRQAFTFLVVTAAILGMIFFALHSILVPRARITASDPAVRERVGYSNIGFAITRTRPLGVGIGNQVLFAAREGLYGASGFHAPAQWQPVHNAYLLMASEIGILGLVAFLSFILLLLVIPKSKIHDSPIIFPALMLFALLLFGITDHFLWTLHQGRLMLWLTIGFMIAAGARSSKERMHPSEG